MLTFIFLKVLENKVWLGNKFKVITVAAVITVLRFVSVGFRLFRSVTVSGFEIISDEKAR